ncbi:MAG: hypothetical protein ACTSVB_00545 [Candidatus Heimdallarchaeaceae archaeon]
MYSSDSQSKLEISKQKISKSSLVLGISYIFIGVIVLTATILFYLGFFAIYKLYIWDIYFVSLVLVLFIYAIIVIFKSIYFFKLSRGYDDLSSELSSLRNLHISAANDASKYIKIGTICELILTFLFPLIVFVILFLPLFFNIFLIPFAFFTLGFIEIRSVFSQLSKHELYSGKFANFLLYSRISVFMAFSFYIYSAIRFLDEMISEAFTSTFNDSFLIWILVAGIILFISQVLLSKGFFDLSKDTHRITI